jgi:hypothetical protein
VGDGASLQEGAGRIEVGADALFGHVVAEVAMRSVIMTLFDRSHLRCAMLVAAAMLTGSPAFAQVDLSGQWGARQHQDWMERLPGPDPVDYIGLPLSEEGRRRALAYDYSIMGMPQHQCGYYTQFYNAIGPQSLKIWSENDPVRGNEIVAWKISGFIDIDVTTIWMDGRPHPPKHALYPYSGFTTGRWTGDILTTYTTHMKAGYIRRNGAPTSDQATMTQHFIRHGDLLTVTTILEDPVYLTEPYVVSRVWELNPRGQTAATSSACEPIAEVPRLDASGVVPHYLPGTNPFVGELTRYYNLPVETVLGGAQTMYPEYRNTLKDKYVRPAQCTRYCGAASPGLSIIIDGTGRPQSQ